MKAYIVQCMSSGYRGDSSLVLNSSGGYHSDVFWSDPDVLWFVDYRAV